MGDSSDQPDYDDRSDDQLTPKEAYSLTKEQGLEGKTVAKMFDVTPGFVSQRKGQWEEALEEGRDSVNASDFEREELEDALGDEPPESNPYAHQCPLCEELIEAPDSAGNHPCPACGETIEWDEDEL